MFDDISGRYDLLNTVLSFGQDKRWRRIAVADIPNDGIIIDLCSAGGEMAQELFARPGFKADIVLADISRNMLSLYRRILEPRFAGRYFPVVCDVEHLPFKADVFSGAMCAFGLRNLTYLPVFSCEVRRVLRPGGLARYLEIGHPKNRVIGAIFKFYFYRLSPLLAGLFTRKTYAYRYLPRSLEDFAPQDTIARILAIRWGTCEYKNIMGGIAAVYKLRKGETSNA